MARTSPLSFGSSLSPMPVFGSSGSPMSGISLGPVGGGLRRVASGAELATALRRSRSGILRSEDLDSIRSTPLAAGGRTGAAAMDRWEPQVRLDTAVASLLSNLAFADGAWWHLSISGSGTLSITGIELVRLTPPVDKDFREGQLPLVQSAAADRDDRLPEILSQVDGFWPFWTAITNLDETNAPRTVELVEVLIAATHAVVMRFKQELALPRPIDLCPTVGPIIGTPGHSTFPSGHATVSFMFARFAARLLNLNSGDKTLPYLLRLAHRIAQNRVVAGVHFPVDSVAGRLLGETLGEYFFARCTGSSADCAGAAFGNPPSKVALEEAKPLAPIDGCTLATSQNVGIDPLLNHLWTHAREELVALKLIASV